jgi:hypothetical protein
MNALTTAIFVVLSKVGGLFAPPIPQAYHEAWQPTRGLTTLPPMEIQTTGGIRMPVTSDGKLWHGPAGSLMAVSRGTSPHRHRETGVLVPPMRRLYPTRLTPIPEMPDWTRQEVQEKRISDALARVDSARLYAEQDWLNSPMPDPAPLVLQPLDSQELSVADRTATTKKPSSALTELAALAGQFDPDKTETAIPAVISQRARELQRLPRERE